MCSLAVPALPRREPAAYQPSAKGLSTLLISSLFFAPWLGVWWITAELDGWPLNDDPFYAKPLAIWSEEGRVQLVRQYGYLTASSVAHIAMGIPAVLGGFSYRNLFLVCGVQQAAGALALYWFARRIKLSHTIAALVAASLTTYPLYFGHAFTYMTDGPATAWSSIACVLLSVGVIERSQRYLAAGALAVGWGYWIRQTNAALLMAPCIAICGLAWSGQARWRLLWPISLALLMIATFETGWFLPTSVSRLHDVAPQTSEGYWRRALIAAYGWLLLLGWYALPVAPWLMQQAWRQLRASDRPRMLLSSTAAALTLSMGTIPFLITSGSAHLTSATGNFIQNGHHGPIFLSDMDEPGRWGELAGVEWPHWVWQLLTLLSIFSASTFAWWASWSVHSSIRHLASRAQPLVIVAAAWFVTILACAVALVLFIEPHLDRYWLFLMPVISVICLMIAAQQRWPMRRSAVAWAAIWVAMHLVMSTVYVHDMLAWNHARWRYVEHHLASGRAAETLDAGRDVNAWLRMDEDPDTSARPGDESRWWSGRASICISTGSRPGWDLVQRLPWYSWATGRTHFLLILQRSLVSR